jgi:predicted phage terminase large subunit-like protein
MNELRLEPGSEKWKTLRHRALTDLFFFCDVVLGYGSLVPMTKRAHLPMCRFAERRTGHDALDGAFYQLITVPRGVGKSTLVTRGRAIQLSLKHPDIAILIANEREKNAVDFLREIKSHFETNDFLRALFPERIPPDFRATQWSETAATLPREHTRPEPTFLATGVGAAITGLHPDYAFIDDMISVEAAENARVGSFALVDKANRWCNQLVPLVKRNDPHCGITFIGTIWWYGDSYEHIEKAFGYGETPRPFSLSYREEDGVEVRVPLVTGAAGRLTSGVYRRGDIAVFRRSIIEDNTSFFPERWPLDELAKFRMRDPVLYAANMMNSPSDEVTATFKQEWLRHYERPHEDTVRWDDGARMRYLQIRDLDVLMSVDPAFTDRGTDSSRAAIAVTGSTADGKRLVLEAIARRMAADSFVDLIVTTAARYKPRKLLIERVAQQAAFIALVKQALAKANVGVSVQEVTPAGQHKDVRILQLEPYFQRGDILFLGSQHDILDEYRDFPRSRDKDLLDALAYQAPFWMRPQEGGASFAAGAEQRIAKEMESLSQRLGHPVGVPLHRGSEPGRVRPDGSKRW